MKLGKGSQQSPDDEPGLPKKRVRLNNDSNEKQDNGSGDKSDQPMDEACFQDDSDQSIADEGTGLESGDDEFTKGAANQFYILKLKNFLRANGVYVETSRTVKMTEGLYNAAQEEEQATWPSDGCRSKLSQEPLVQHS